MGAVTNDRDENTMTVARLALLGVVGLVAWVAIYHGSIWLQDLMFGAG